MATWLSPTEGQMMNDYPPKSVMAGAVAIFLCFLIPLMFTGCPALPGRPDGDKKQEKEKWNRVKVKFVDGAGKTSYKWVQAKVIDDLVPVSDDGHNASEQLDLSKPTSKTPEPLDDSAILVGLVVNMLKVKEDWHMPDSNRLRHNKRHLIVARSGWIAINLEVMPTSDADSEKVCKSAEPVFNYCSAAYNESKVKKDHELQMRGIKALLLDKE